ncbi:hypothetical protein F4809DRAFT_588289 [Biscogniauxia mediterranea]|nr:hypothetical protein F4809DRAFT_588289 [Biscogniauxia mediterranea]
MLRCIVVPFFPLSLFFFFLLPPSAPLLTPVFFPFFFFCKYCISLALFFFLGFAGCWLASASASAAAAAV